jgi:hypothetical protein
VWNSDFAAVYTMAQDPSGGADCIIDSTSNANHGTPGGSMTSGDLVDGDIGKAIDFDGSDDWVDIGSSLPVGTIGSKISISCKIKIEDLGFTDGRTILGNNDEYQVAIEQAELWVRTQGGNNGGDGSSLVTGAWYHIAVVWDVGSRIKAYVDGSLTKDISESDTSADTGESFALGANVNPSSATDNFFDGLISELAISDGGLTDAWIKADYHAQTDNLITWGAEDTSGVGYFDGYITYFGQPAQRKVNLHRSSTGELVDSITSSNYDGYYSLKTYYNEEHYLVCLAASGSDYEDQIVGNVYPKLY